VVEFVDEIAIAVAVLAKGVHDSATIPRRSNRQLKRGGCGTRVNEQPTAMICSPRPILDVFVTIDDEPCPRLTQGESPQRFQLLCPANQL
jgi:hypothetical protein